MPVESRASKRKSTAEVTQKPKKSKKVVEEITEVSTIKKIVPKKSLAVEADAAPVSTKPSRKRAADYFDGDDTANAPIIKSKTKKVKKTDSNDAPIATDKVAVKKTSKSKRAAAIVQAEESSDHKASNVSTTDNNNKKGGEAIETAMEAPETAEVEVDEDEVDDQTAALLKGFESSEDEEEIMDNETEGIENVPSAPTNKALQKKLKAAAENDDKRGVIYVGRIPHGFYEHQMRAYFSQFGDITRLRLSRNKKTGASKHYAFVEFQSSEVARIVANTMDKYLMFNHILQVRTIPPERVHENLFAGANSRFKAVPRNKLAGKHLRQPLHREGWEKRIVKENKRRAANSEKLKAIGYDFESPAVISVDQLAVKAIDSPTDQLVLTEEPHDSADEVAIEAKVTTEVESKAGTTKVVETVVKKRKVADRKVGATLDDSVHTKSSDKKGSKARSKKSKVPA